MVGLIDYGKRWRITLCLMLSAVLLAAVMSATAPVVHAASVRALLSVDSTWQTGFIARFTIVNSSTVPLTDWRLEFDLPAGESISHTWSSTIVQSGTHYVVGPANWNRIIQPGASATGGMRGVLTGPYSPPVNCMLNRQVLCS